MSAVAQFGEFEANLRSRELRRNGANVRLPGQSFEILDMLLQHPGELVTREEIRKRLWPTETFVDFDHGLNNAVNRLREALGDSAEHPASSRLYLAAVIGSCSPSRCQRKRQIRFRHLQSKPLDLQGRRPSPQQS
jgi:DNA-binding response OmpR family regulator